MLCRKYQEIDDNLVIVCLKWFFTICNILLIGGGITCLVFTVVFYLQTVDYFGENHSDLMNAHYFILMGVCVFVILVSFLGFVGAVCENRLALFAYACIMTFVALLSIAGVALGAIYHSRVKEESMTWITTWVKDNFQNAANKVEDGIQTGIESLMSDKKCCFTKHTVKKEKATIEDKISLYVEFFKFWHDNSGWFKKIEPLLRYNDPSEARDIPILPDHCCVDSCPVIIATEYPRNVSAFQNWLNDYPKKANKYFHQKSCYEYLLNMSSKAIVIICVTTMIILVLLMFQIISSVCLYRHIDEVEYKPFDSSAKPQYSMSSMMSTPRSCFTKIKNLAPKPRVRLVNKK